jgi:hypothetical protein
MPADAPRHHWWNGTWYNAGKPLKEVMQTAKQLAPGDLVRVVQRSAPEATKQRRYRILKINSQYELVHLEWVDAPDHAKDRYEWILKDYVRLL